MTVLQTLAVIFIFALNIAIPLWLMWEGEQHRGY